MPQREQQRGRSWELRRRVERLSGLPLRPATVRHLLADVLEPRGEAETRRLAGTRLVRRDPAHAGVARRCPTAVDPGWAAAGRTDEDGSAAGLALVAASPWWRPGSASEAGTLDRLWRHAVATAAASRRLAEEAGDPEPALAWCAGLLHNLGLWLIAAVAPARLAELLAEPDPGRRRGLERAWLGTEAATLGRACAERWGCPPAVIDATWLHAERPEDWQRGAEDPRRLARVQSAFAWAERTPWALGTEERPAGWDSADPRLRWLMAEVQARCGAPLAAPDATPHEERLARAHAGLLLRHREADLELRAHRRLGAALDASGPWDGPARWCERAARAWSEEPGVLRAAVTWGPGEGVGRTDPDQASSVVLPLGGPGRPVAELRLWPDPGAELIDPAGHPTWPAWSAWAALVAACERSAGRLEAATEAAHRRDDRRRAGLPREKLAALAEFAAGAGHELNNPLAVILGRAQLLLARLRDADPDAARSLRAIVAQAQRAHRILRDLIYFARPPAPRIRPCAPLDILRACLRDLEEDAAARGVRLVLQAPDPDATDPGARAWTDPDALHHLAEVFLRNALEAAPAGSTVRLDARGTAARLDWTIHNDGPALDPAAAAHLFDPFYCGRQAGRGLGLGLPRAARTVERLGGRLRWSSSPAAGTTFHLTVPTAAPPDLGAGREPPPPG